MIRYEKLSNAPKQHIYAAFSFSFLMETGFFSAEKLIRQHPLSLIHFSTMFHFYAPCKRFQGV